ADRPPAVADPRRNLVPQLPRAELGVEKALDEARLRLVGSAGRRGLPAGGQGMAHRLHQRQALDALRAPLGADLMAGHAPDFLGIRLEEGPVELRTKAVDQEVLETAFRMPGEQRCVGVAQAGPEKA